ncbi:cell cycle protein FtsW [Listeria floridensis FSL S10-1187]|uniref:Probable peptidoglycan glycosyltransferase FtsW n=1 Tax=Listeria floridensis FSL S10-1187 TaxID=1265817 RepID=A0ABN0RH27_9LIST|nr:FtsW/RodA/SpoVE family cell cycle protein [Listeria floridensis]EUJ33078.1 cell cycle protein FtsW [Listeria floridensis FSL S10-1187]
MLKRILKSYDYSLIVVYILLCLFGLIMVYSASWSLAYRHELPADFYYIRQIKNLIISFLFFLLFALFPYRIYQHNKFLMPMMFGSIALLLMIFMVGHAANNAQSWFRLGSASLQPGEFVKVSVIIYLAAIYAKKQKYIDDFNKGVLPPVFFLAFVCFLIAIQPDLGTAFIIFLTGCCIILCSGMRFKSMLKLIGLGLGILLVLSIIVFLLPEDIQVKIISPTRMGRITSFLNPFLDAGQTGHQLVNSFYAIGSGGIFGQGLGQSVQKLGYLPEAHTDFIISVIAEELGVFGVLFVVIGLFFIIFKTILTGLRADNPFGSLLCYGTAGLIGIQAFINLGGASGTIPITGVTLPFISYGGSSLMVLSVLMGIVINVGMFTNYKRKYGRKDNDEENT